MFIVEKLEVIITVVYEHIDHIASTTIAVDYFGRYTAKAHFVAKKKLGSEVNNHPWLWLRRNHPIERLGSEDHGA